MDLLKYSHDKRTLGPDSLNVKPVVHAHFPCGLYIAFCSFPGSARNFFDSDLNGFSFGSRSSGSHFSGSGGGDQSTGKAGGSSVDASSASSTNACGGGRYRSQRALKNPDKQSAREEMRFEAMSASKDGTIGAGTRVESGTANNGRSVLWCGLKGKGETGIENLMHGNPRGVYLI
jgi:hypothetical protein